MPDLRPSERYGVNLSVSVEEAERAAVQTLRPGSPYYLWRTDDGLFAWSAIPDRVTPYLVTAVLVGGPLVTPA